MPLPVKRSMIRILQQPHFEYALARIKIRRGAKNVEKDRLDDFFRLARIVDNSQRNVENKVTVTVKKARKSVVAAKSHVADQLFVRELRKILGLQPKGSKTHLPLKPFNCHVV
jgi:hypothetical protein